MASPVQSTMSTRERQQSGVLWKIQGIFRDLPDYIPFTPAFRRHYEGEIAKHVAIDLHAFDDLATVAAPSLATLRPEVAEYEQQLARWIVTAHYFYRGAFVVFAGAVACGAPIYTQGAGQTWLQSDSLSSGSLVAAFLVYGFTLLLAGLFAVMLTGTGSPDWRIVKYLGMLCALGMVYMIVLYGVIWAAKLDAVADLVLGVAIGFLISLVMLIGIIGEAALATLVFHLLYAGKYLRYPVAIIVDELIDALWTAQRGTAYWTDLAGKQYILTRLEAAAQSIEFQLTRRLRPGDSGTELWWRETARRIALALREKKKWVLTPQPDTYTNFLTAIRTTLYYVFLGQWDALEQIDPKDATPPPSWQAQVLRAGRTLIVALLPVVGLFVVQMQPALRIGGTVRDYVTGAVIIWALLNVLSAMDSQFSTKISYYAQIKNPFLSKPD